MNIRINKVVKKLNNIVEKKKRIKDHFESIASEYSEELPPHYQKYLLKRKMAYVLNDCDNLGDKIGLDIGCGQGFYVQHLKRKTKKMVGIDFSFNNVRNTLKLRNSNIKYGLNSDGTQLPFKSNYFDFCYSINVIHHLPSRALHRKFINEMIRVVKPGGMIFIFDLSLKNPIFALYLKYIFPIIRKIDEGDELFFKVKDILKITKEKADFISADYYSFIPDIVPRSMMKLLTKIESKIEMTKLKKLGMHQVIVLKKK